jgi:hypothetical protein
MASMKLIIATTEATPIKRPARIRQAFVFRLFRFVRAMWVRVMVCLP